MKNLKRIKNNDIHKGIKELLPSKLDISIEYKGHFYMIPYHSCIKILHRLAEEGILMRYSRKTFLVAPNEKFDLDSIIFIILGEVMV